MNLNFIVTPRPCFDSCILNSVNEFRRRMNLKWFFFNKDENKERKEDMKDSTILKFYTPNLLFDPRKSKHWVNNRKLELYLNNIDVCINNSIKSNKPKCISNLPKSTRYAITTLRKNKEIIVRKSDKGLGPVVINKSWYMKEMHRHLNDRSKFNEISLEERLDLEKGFMSCVARSSSVEVLKFPEYLINFLFCRNSNNCSVPIVHLLPKIHKLSIEDLKLPLEIVYDKLQGRMLATCHSYITTNLSKFLAFILQHTCNHIPIILKNSFVLVEELAKIDVPIPKEGEEIFIVVGDVKELYPNMPGWYEDYKIYLKNYFRSHPSFPQLGVGTFCWLLGWVLSLSICEFDKKLYRQNKGIFMGTPVAPPLANLFMHYIEDKIISKFADVIVLFRRFIDDIFTIFVGTREKLNAFLDVFNTTHPNVSINWSVSTISNNFMDLTIYKGGDFERTRKLSVKVFQKPLNAYLYLVPFSFHSRHIFRGFIKGELIRYLRYSTEEKDFLSIKRDFLFRLLARGYSFSFLEIIFDSIQYYDRHNYMLSRKEGRNTNNVLVFKIRDDTLVRDIKIKSILLDHWHIIESDSTLATLFPQPPIMSYSSNPSIASLLAPSRIV